jgi:hypothetical protein
MIGDIKKAKAKLKQAALVEEDGQALFALGEARLQGGFGFKRDVQKAKDAFNLSALAGCPWGVARHLMLLHDHTTERTYWKGILSQSNDLFAKNWYLYHKHVVLDDSVIDNLSVCFSEGNVFSILYEYHSHLRFPSYDTLHELGYVTDCNLSVGVKQKHHDSLSICADNETVGKSSFKMKCCVLTKNAFALVFVLKKSESDLNLIHFYRIGRAFSWDVDFYYACQIRAAKLGVSVIKDVEYCLNVYHTLWARIRRVCLTLLLGKVWGKDLTRVIAKLVWDGRKKDIKKGIWRV